MSASAAPSARHIEVRRGCTKRRTGRPSSMRKMRCTVTPSTTERAGWPWSRQIMETRYPCRAKRRARMHCCTSAPPTILISGSRESTGHACGATKQILCTLRRRLARQHAVHHADRHPKVGELVLRPQARSCPPGDREAQQRRSGPLEEGAQLGRDVLVAAQRTEAAPDMQEVKAEEHQAAEAHVEHRLQV